MFTLRSAALIAVATVAAVGCSRSPDPAATADTLYVGGDIVTVNDAQPTAEALAVRMTSASSWRKRRIKLQFTIYDWEFVLGIATFRRQPSERTDFTATLPWHHPCCVVSMSDSLPIYENGQDVRDRALALACQTVRFCRQLYDAGGGFGGHGGAALVGQVGIAGSAELGDFVVIGGQAGVVGHIKVGRGAQIAGAAHAKDDVPAGARMAGTPARPFREWAREVALLNRLARRGVEPKGGEGE